MCGNVTFSTISSCTPIFPFKSHSATSFVIHEWHMCTIGQTIQVLTIYQTLKLGIRLLNNHLLQGYITKLINQIWINPKRVIIVVLKVIIGLMSILEMIKDPYDDFQYDNKNIFLVYLDLVDPFRYRSL